MHYNDPNKIIRGYAVPYCTEQYCNIKIFINYLQENEIENLKKELDILHRLLNTGKFSISENKSTNGDSAELESVRKENEKLKMRINILKNVCIS